jgi:hypothetical protein
MEGRSPPGRPRPTQQLGGGQVKKGTKVSWTTGNGTAGGADLLRTVGHGVTIADEDDGKILVAVHSMGEMHHVIWCNVTWLTAEAPPTAAAM